MKIKNITEGLRKDEYYIWTVTFKDGTSSRVKIKWDETSQADLEAHFKKPIAKIDHNFDIHGGEDVFVPAASKEYHDRQDQIEKNVAKDVWQMRPTFNESIDYDKIVEDVIGKWAATKEIVNELSVGALRDYAAKSKEVNPVVDRFKTVKHAAGLEQANKRIAQKTGDRTRRTFESKLAGFIEEANEFTDILSKQHAEAPVAKKMPVKDIPFHGWTIRYRPASAGEKVQWQVMDKKGDVKHRGESMAERDAVSDAEDWIKTGGGSGQEAVDKVIIDFNAPFTKQFAPIGETFYAGFTSDGNMPVLVISSEAQPGLKRSHSKPVRTGVGSPVISLSAKEANSAKLQPNGRYVLGNKEQLDDNTMSFPLIFQSVAQSTTDKVRMGQPGLIVAASR